MAKIFHYSHLNWRQFGDFSFVDFFGLLMNQFNY